MILVTGGAGFIGANYPRQLHTARSGTRLVGQSGGSGTPGLALPAYFHRRGLRFARHRGCPIRGDTPIPAEQPLFGVEGGLGSSGPRLPSHLRPAGADHQLLEQPWSVPVPGKADPAGDQQRAAGQGAADLRRRHERARLAPCRRPLRRHPCRAGGRPSRRDIQLRRLERDAESGPCRPPPEYEP